MFGRKKLTPPPALAGNRFQKLAFLIAVVGVIYFLREPIADYFGMADTLAKLEGATHETAAPEAQTAAPKEVVHPHYARVKSSRAPLYREPGRGAFGTASPGEQVYLLEPGASGAYVAVHHNGFSAYMSRSDLDFGN